MMPIPITARICYDIRPRMAVENRDHQSIFVPYRAEQYAEVLDPVFRHSSLSMPVNYFTDFISPLLGNFLDAVSSLVHDAHTGIRDQPQPVQPSQIQVCGFIKTPKLEFWCEMTILGVIKFFRSLSGTRHEVQQLELSDVVSVSELERKVWVCSKPF